MRHDLITLLAGAYDVGFGIFHLFFPKLFHWDRALPKLDVVNRGIFLALHYLMILVFLLVGYALLTLPGDTATIKTLTFGAAAFWGLRAVMQPVLWPFQSHFAYGMFALFILGTLLHAGSWLTS